MKQPSSPPELLRSFALKNAKVDYAPGQRVISEQRGTMRLKPDAAWRPFTAEQWSSVDDTAFVWHARFSAFPLVTMVVEDAYENGHGRLDVKAWGKLPVAHDEGPSVDQGEVQRYLAELPWNPAAILHNRSLQFESRGDNCVRAWTGQKAHYVDLFFNAAGDIERTFTDTRHRGTDGPAPWEGRFLEYRAFGGLRVPARGEVAWLLPEGRFCYWRGEIVTIDTGTYV